MYCVSTPEPPGRTISYTALRLHLTIPCPSAISSTCELKMSKHNLPRGKKYSYYLPMGDEPVPVQSAPRPTLPAETSNSRKNDNFYPAWDSFLATSPHRATKTSAKALKTAQIQAATASDPLAPGLNVHEPVSTSYDQAASQCRAKVAAIVEAVSYTHLTLPTKRIV